MGSLFSSPAEWTPRGRSFLITGASSGIGAETARQLSERGAKNLALIARNNNSLERVAEECRELGAGSVKTYTADLTDRNSIESATSRAVADFTSFDVVVLNAGRSQGCYFEEIKDVAQIEYMVNLNITGVITSLHYLMPSLKKSSDSRIVVISSTAGIVGVPYRTIYCGTKHALTGFCSSLRMELKDTYGADSPAVCLINFAEVSGTKVNDNRMDFGADLPPAVFDAGSAGVLSLKEAVQGLVSAIAAGKREWGQPLKATLLRPFSFLIPDLIDSVVMKHIRRNTYRQGKPIDQS